MIRFGCEKYIGGRGQRWHTNREWFLRAWTQLLGYEHADIKPAWRILKKIDKAVQREELAEISSQALHAPADPAIESEPLCKRK